MTSTDVNDLLMGSGGPPAFKFAEIGDTAKGVITDLGQNQVRDFATGEPRTYTDGNPIMQIVVTIQDDDGEDWRIFLKPAAKAAVRDAVKEAGAEGLEVGGRIAVQYTADEPQATPGLNPKKLFKAQYEPPSKTVSANDLL